MKHVITVISFTSQKTGLFIQWNLLIRIMFQILFKEKRYARGVQLRKAVTPWIQRTLWIGLGAAIVHTIILPFVRVLFLLHWPNGDEFGAFFESRGFFMTIAFIFLLCASYVVVKYNKDAPQEI